MTSKHTPGPWRQSLTDDTRIIDSSGCEVASVAGDYQHDYARMEANARLIAAAPELLEALAGMVDSYELEASPINPALISARAAIAKATGASAETRVALRGEHPPCPGCLDTECNGECMENL